MRNRVSKVCWNEFQILISTIIAIAQCKYLQVYLLLSIGLQGRFSLCCLSRSDILTDSRYVVSLILISWLILPMLARSCWYSDWFSLCWLANTDVLIDSRYVVSLVVIFWPILAMLSLSYWYSDWCYVCWLAHTHIQTDSCYVGSLIVMFWLILAMLSLS